MSASGLRTRAGAPSRRRRPAGALGALAAALLLACASPDGAWPLLGAMWGDASKPWSGYVNEGPLPVDGAGADAPGPSIFRYVARQPALAGFLREQGPPSSLEVARRGGEPIRILLAYPEREGDCRIRLERAAGGDGRWSASLPSCPSAPRATPAPERRAPEREDAPPPGGGPVRESEGPSETAAPSRACSPPTAVQRLECPIDPDREDCAALCRCDDGLEWCE